MNNLERNESMKEGKNIVISSTESTECHIDDCQYKKQCANHVTAGDHRIEGGFSPFLTFGQDENKIVCWSMFCESDEYGYRDEPVNSNDSGYVDYNAVSNNITIPLECEYCERSNTFHVKYDVHDETIKLRCTECKALLDIDKNKKIEVIRKERREKAREEVAEYLFKDQDQPTQEELDEIEKEWAEAGLITKSIWECIKSKVPNLTVNGTQMHKSSTASENLIHAKWDEEKGLIICKEDIKSFENPNITLKESKKDK